MLHEADLARLHKELPSVVLYPVRVGTIVAGTTFGVTLALTSLLLGATFYLLGERR